VKFELPSRATVLAQIRALKTDDWRPYNRAARYLLDASVEPGYAMELVDKSIKLKEQWENLWTKAQLLAAAGNTKQALAMAQRTQELGTKSKDFFYKDEVAQAISDWKK
jgi:gamma-glutamyltranspeptidase